MTSRPRSPQLGTVLTYQAVSDDPTLITHRVTAITESATGRRTFTLQGDNNSREDPRVRSEQVMGKVLYAVPYFGWVANTLNTGDGPKYAHWAAYACLGYSAVMMLLAARSKLRPSPAGATAPPRHRSAGPSPLPGLDR